MEGPSIHLAVEQLQPFVGRRVLAVDGNSRIGIDRLRRKTVRRVFAWGKQLVLQFDTFGLRVHFLLWGTFAATIKDTPVTGDYRRTSQPRLVLRFANGEITMWACSLRYLETPDARALYDFRADVLSPAWDPARAFSKARRHPRAEIADVLLDQEIFAGVGNIIKNEVLFRTRTSPFTRVSRIPAAKLRAIVEDARVFSERFLELRRRFALRKSLEIYGRSVCAACGGKLGRRTHGTRQRRSFYCFACQRVRQHSQTPARKAKLPAPLSVISADRHAAGPGRSLRRSVTENS